MVKPPSHVEYSRSAGVSVTKPYFLLRPNKCTVISKLSYIGGPIEYDTYTSRLSSDVVTRVEHECD